jgi:5,6-dimethylbenzimidazole synthase
MIVDKSYVSKNKVSMTKADLEPSFSAAFLDELDDLLIWRRDVRHFDTRPLDAGLLDTLLDRASLAPSVGNSQPWRFVRVVTPKRRAAIIAHVEAENARAAGLYVDEARAAYDALKLHGLNEAPEHIAVFCDPAPGAGHGLGRATMAETLAYSTVLAIHTLWLAARARGVGLGWVSILQPDAIAALLDVPHDWTFIGYLCLGYPLEAHDVPELERSGWQARIDAHTTRFTR